MLGRAVERIKHLVFFAFVGVNTLQIGDKDVKLVGKSTG